MRLYLDQADPVADVEITSYRMPGQPSIPAGSCMKFPVGAIIAGTFSATDEHFDSIGFAVEGTSYSATTPGGTAALDGHRGDGLPGRVDGRHVRHVGVRHGRDAGVRVRAALHRRRPHGQRRGRLA